MEGSSNISNLISSLEINTTRIDRACEKAMILFVHRHQVELISDLDTVWKEFLRCYPGDQNLGLDYDYSDLKLHYLCMDRSTNKWGLDEEVYLYFRYGAHVEEGFAEPEKDPENVNVNLGKIFDFLFIQNDQLKLYLLCRSDRQTSCHIPSEAEPQLWALLGCVSIVHNCISRF